MTTKFYWADDVDFVLSGPFSTAQDAKDNAAECVSYTRTVTILSVWSVSKPPSLKRKWS